MVNNMIQQLKLFLAAILLIAMGTAFADNLPDYYPDEFQRAGILNKIDSKSRTATIDGHLYYFSSDLLVHSLSTQFSSVNSLRPSTPVGFGVSRIGNKYYIDTIWVLPSNYKLPERG